MKTTTHSRARDLGIVIGEHPVGPYNAITDVPGVRVGSVTLNESGPPGVHTGVTVVVPHDNIWHEPIFAGSHRLNGSGEMTGLPWIYETGELTSAIAITNTHSVGVVRDALVKAQVDARGDGAYWSLPVVGETYDGLLNDINGFHVRAEHVAAALSNASSGPVAEGNVGGGAGMICHEFKGGTGTASRVTDTALGEYTVGVLVQANHGRRKRLRINGVPVGELIGADVAPLPEFPAGYESGSGSIIVIVATDAPLLPHQCSRLAQRAALAVANIGGSGEQYSGDLMLAFSTGLAEALDSNNPEAMAPPGKAMSWKQAALDIQALRDGHATPIQIQRLRAATHLAPEDLAKLSAGQPANIPQGQFDYLQSVMQNLHGTSLEDMLDIDKQAPGALGDAIRLMSMPNLRTEGGSQGGMADLPISIRTLLQQSPILTTSHVPDTPGAGIQFMTAVPRLGDFNALDTLLTHGNQNLRLGADVDRGLIKQASEISAAMAPRGSHDYFGTYDNRQELGSIRQTVDAMLHNGGGDHQAVADFLTGDNMASTVTPGNHYNADSHVLSILEQKWEPDELGAKSMLHWIGDAANNHGYEGVLGGRSADALANLMVGSHDKLAYIGPSGGPYTSLGILNPELTQQLSRSLSPYFPNFAGYPSDLLLNHTAGPLANTPDFGKLLGLLGTDHTAGDIAIRSSAAWENYAAHQYGENPMDVGLGTSASHLHQSVIAGIDDTQNILKSNDEWTTQVEYANKQEYAANMLGLVQGLGIPGLSDAATIAGPAIADDYAGPMPGDPAQHHPWQDQIDGYNNEYDRLTSGTARDYQIASGYLDNHPEIINRHWTSDSGTSIDFFQKDRDGRTVFNWDIISKNPRYFETFLNTQGVPVSSGRKVRCCVRSESEQVLRV